MSVAMLALFIPLIILAVIIVVGLIVVLLIVKFASNTVSKISDSPIMEDIRQQEIEFSNTPKSVSGMTNLVLPQISADFPEFNYEEMKNRSDNLLISYLSALTENNPKMLEDAGDELRDQLDNQIKMLANQGLHDSYKQVHIHNTEINRYSKADGRCIIIFQSAIECYHTLSDSNGNIKSGSNDSKYQTRFNVEMIYVQDKDKIKNDFDQALGVTCPNCGAPIKNLGARFCEYCGTTVVPININSWTFAKIDEV